MVYSSTTGGFSLKVLDLMIQAHDLPDNHEPVTVQEYLVEVLLATWKNAARFSPFGNGGWQYNLYDTLIKEGFIAGKFDKHGFLIDFDKKTADAMISAAILEEFGRKEPVTSVS